MKIRTKIITVLALLFAEMIALQIFVQQQVLMPSFAALEREDAFKSMTRVDSTLKSALANLSMVAADWGNWADLFEFVKAPAPQFVSTNITLVALRQLQVNSIFIIDMQGNLVLASSRDLDTGAAINVDLTDADGKSVPENFPWRSNLTSGSPAQGLIRTRAGIMLLAAAPVLDGTGAGPSRGLVLMGKLLTARQLRAFGAQAQANFVMVPARGTPGVDHLIEAEAVTQVLRPYADIYGKPLMSLAVEVPRKITERGGSAVTFASGCLIVGGIAALLLLLYVLSTVVLAPLSRVTRHAVKLGEGGDLAARLNLPGEDEVALLAGEFDRMVAKLADSRRQLVDQSFHAGFAELARGVLHNLGNAMTPLSVRLATLEERLRDAPLSDLQLALAELASEPAGTPRHEDLLEFLRLAGRELGGVIKEAQADVLVVQRQAQVVQTALAELMRSTRNEPVVEPVRLPELVSQTLEIVPDACRQRLRVESDESLQQIGAVHVARTVLRLVLQNLIINAADAVRDAGRERGVLRVAAEIERELEQEQLHLRCEDDGAGISQDNLERVFEKGFSTKSRETNHGIGLHWCANAIAALGGRIWAVSPGPGRGACVHFVVPLSQPPTPLTV